MKIRGYHNNMLCNFCHKNEAVFFIEQVNKEGSRRISICMECAVKYGISPDPKTIQQSISSLFAEVAKSDIDPDTQKLCPVCGCSLAVIKKTGKAGCPECYAIFKNEIAENMQERNIKGPYTGSLPLRIAGFHSRLTDRVDIQAKLEESVRNEDYEKAAVYRDYLKALDKPAVSDSSMPEGSA